MAEPFTIRMAPRKPTFLVGEGVLVDLEYEVGRPLRIEPVERNARRTRLVLTPLAPPGPAVELSGASYAALHRPHPQHPVGTPFDAVPGRPCRGVLELLTYHRPLPAGRYRLGLTYEYAPGAVARADDVELEVAPARVVDRAARWSAGSEPRHELATLSALEAGGAEQVLYACAHAWDPGVLITSVPVPLPARPLPRLAHLNDIEAFHLERRAVWLDGAHVASRALERTGHAGDLERVAHGLTSPALVDPPLQLASNELAFVVVGADAAGPVAVLQRGPERAVVRLPGPPLEAPLVVWRDESPLGAELWGLSRDGAITSLVRVLLPTGERTVVARFEDQPVRGLIVDQWLGTGHLLAVVELPALAASSPPALQVMVLDLEAPRAAAAGTYDAPQGSELICVAPLAAGAGAVLLVRGATGDLHVRGPAGRRVVELASGERAWLDVDDEGVAFLSTSDADRGLRVVRVREAGAEEPR